MIGLFKEAPDALKMEDAWEMMRSRLISSLNKGKLPRWEELSLDFLLAENLEVLQDKFLQLTQWSFLERIFRNEGNEYFFHSKKHSQVLLKTGEKVSVSIPLEERDWQLWLEVMSIHFQQNWNVKNPFVSFHAELFGRHFRISLIHGSTSPLGQSKFMARSIAETSHPLDSFGSSEILKDLVEQKRNFIIAGSTGSGKTSLLSSLLGRIPSHEHLAILEDTYEILSDHSHQTRFLSSDSHETSLKSYLAYCLRLSPDRIILGEMRSHEVVPFLMAMNTGHKGLMSTVHASSAHDALYRVALLFTLYGGEARLDHDKVMELLCRNLEYVVFMENKKVKEVIKVLGSENGTPFFETLVGKPALWT